MTETPTMAELAISPSWLPLPPEDEQLQQAFDVVDRVVDRYNLSIQPEQHQYDYQALRQREWSSSVYFCDQHPIITPTVVASSGFDGQRFVMDIPFSYCQAALTPQEQEAFEQSDMEDFSHSDSSKLEFCSQSDFCQSDSQVSTSDSAPPTPSSLTDDVFGVLPSPQPSRRRDREKHTTYSRWTPEEDEALRSAVQIYGPHKWTLIASRVPTRSAMQCSTRWSGALNPSIHKGRWTPQEDQILRRAYYAHCNLRDHKGVALPIPWNKIALQIANRTGSQCQARWTEALDPTVKKGKWSPQEDAILRNGVARFNKRWIRIAEYIEGRTQRQCRTRWVQLMSQEKKSQGKGTRAPRGKREVELLDGISTLISFDKMRRHQNEGREFAGVRLRRDSVSTDGSLDGGVYGDVDECSDEEMMY